MCQLKVRDCQIEYIYNFKAKYGHYIVIKRTILREVKVILNLFAFGNIASKYVRQS